MISGLHSLSDQMLYVRSQSLKPFKNNYGTRSAISSLSFQIRDGILLRPFYVPDKKSERTVDREY